MARGSSTANLGKRRPDLRVRHYGWRNLARAEEPHSSGTPALRRPAKKVVSNKARTFGTP